MSLKDRTEATAKNIEGKVQEAVGELTGDPKAQVEGKEKQAEAKVRHTIEDVKDEVKKIIAFLIHKRYIPDPEQFNQQRFKCAAQMREPLY